MVIGDGKNDIEMFEWAGYSGCLKNGCNNVKNISTYVSKNTNNESGVSEIIEYFLEIEE